MDRRRLRLLAMAVAGSGVFASMAIAVAAGFAGRPVTLRSRAPRASDVALVGDRAAWLELEEKPDSQAQFEATLVLRRVAAAEAVRVPVPALDVGPQWLVAGPAMTGDCTPRPDCWAVAFVGETFRSDRLFVYRAPEGQWSVYDAPGLGGPAGDSAWWRDLTAAGELVAFTVLGTGEIRALDLTTGTIGRLVAAPGEGIETHPAVGRDWLVWVEEPTRDMMAAGGAAPGGASIQTVGGRLMARPLPDGSEGEVATGATGQPAVFGGRALWRRLDPGGATTELWLTNLATRQSGRLAAHPSPANVTKLQADITAQLVVRTGAGAAGPALIAHDARAITSFANLDTYLTGFAVADVMTAAAAPAASGSRLAWTEQEPGAPPNLQRIRYLSLVRRAVYLPWARPGARD